MDTTKLLLGTIIALLLAAVVMSWNTMQQGVKNTSADEYERLRKSIDELRADRDRDAAAKIQQTAAVPVAPPTSVSDDEREALKQQAKEAKDKLLIMQEEKAKAERNAKVSDSENLEMVRRQLEKKNSLARDTRLIVQALLVGKVKEYVEDAQTGGFVTLDVVMPDQVQANTILAIRRNSGILGQLKITSVEGGEAVATVLPGFGTVAPVPGDELILPPRF